MDTTDKLVILDGAMGTMLQKAGMQAGEIPELLNVKDPQMIKEVHRKYIEAGSDIIYACTFGANSKKMGREIAEEIIKTACGHAREIADQKGAKVALDIGPIGEMLEPMGNLKFEEAIEIFKQVIMAGKDLVDIIVIETMTDLYEVKAAILAARETCDKPIFVTMTFEEDGRTFAGVSLETFVNAVDGLGVSAIGMNCSLGPVEMYPMAKKLASMTDLDLILKPNAGLPDMDGNYKISKEDFVKSMEAIYELGFKYLGGCCGTDQSYIELLAQKLKGKRVKERRVERLVGASSATKYVPADSFRIVGESLNPTGRVVFQQALKDENMAYLIGQAIEQVDAGADILDVNVGHPGIDEADMQAKITKALQSVLDTPLQIDSTKPQAIEAALRVYNGRAIVNSVTGEEDKLRTILPLVKKYNAQVIGLLLDEKGLPKTAEERLRIARRIINRAEKYGIRKEDIYLDCLTLTLSSQPEEAFETLKAVRLIKEKLGVKTVLGVSNISFGLPRRELINSSFLTLALYQGLDLGIINPNSPEMIDAVRTFRLLNREAGAIEKYIEDYGSQEGKKKTHQTYDLISAVHKGMAGTVSNKVEELLEEKSELEIIDNYLIPALDQVGKDYEEGKIFLPQLIKSASAAQAGFEVIKEKILKSGKKTVSKGDIIVATVKGDIHDIGKNIAKVILENYGYNVIDLGRDVEAEKIIQVSREKNVKLIGLSALMTTSLENMKKTIQAIKKELPDRLIMVGGAVLTEDYARQIDAHYYLKDAKANVEVARQVLGKKGKN